MWAAPINKEMTKEINPYIILGCGRSGTSTVARVLHEKLDVDMGSEFVVGNDANPDGTYEDYRIWYLNREFFYHGMDFPQWASEVEKYLIERTSQADGGPWGFKENRMSVFFGFLLSYLDNPRIIRCVREKHLVLQSMERWWNNTIRTAKQYYNLLNTALDRILDGKDHLTISFCEERKSDEEIIEEIKGKWPII